MKTFIFLLFIITTLTGCSVTAPLKAEFSDGTEDLRGQAVATLVSGTFSAKNSVNLTCRGNYNQYDRNPLLKVTVMCDDGRQGTVEVMRYGQNLENGVGIGVLNDGTKMRISIGINIYSNDVNESFKKN